MNAKDITIRALKTFAQAFVPVVVVALKTMDITGIDEIKALAYTTLISGCAAGLSAVMNLFLELLNKKSDKTVPEDNDKCG